MSFHEPTPPAFEPPYSDSQSWLAAPPAPAAPSPWTPQLPGGPMSMRGPAPRIEGAATLAIVGSGVFALGMVLLQGFSAAYAGSTTPSNGVAALAVLALAVYGIGAIFGYVTLCLWMVKGQQIARGQGYPWPATWKIWAAWFIPFYNLVAPYRAMSTLAYKAGSARLAAPLAVWWSGWILALLVDRINGAMADDADFVRPASVIAAVAFAASYAGLVVVIRRISVGLDAPVPLAS